MAWLFLHCYLPLNVSVCCCVHLVSSYFTSPGRCLPSIIPPYKNKKFSPPLFLSVTCCDSRCLTEVKNENARKSRLRHMSKLVGVELCTSALQLGLPRDSVFTLYVNALATNSFRSPVPCAKPEELLNQPGYFSAGQD